MSNKLKILFSGLSAQQQPSCAVVCAPLCPDPKQGAFADSCFTNAGVGDKQVLREGLRILGLPRAAARVKRAIQFGSRIGKKANQRDFGSNRKANLASAGSVKLQDVPTGAVGDVGRENGI